MVGVLPLFPEFGWPWREERIQRKQTISGRAPKMEQKSTEHYNTTVPHYMWQVDDVSKVNASTVLIK
jgi:hypothetical protein